MKAAEWHSAIQAFVAATPDILAFGCTEPGPAPSEARLRRFLAQGHAAGMEYLTRQVEERVNPKLLAPWAKTLVLMSLKPAAPLRPAPQESDAPAYDVASYAKGDDYHYRARRHLQALEAHFRALDPDLQFRGFVDTSPLFERDFAAEAGLGWRAKNCTLLSREQGSHFLLFGCLLSAEVTLSQPVAEFCGGCTRCLDACPTSAFTAPGELDARLCISYHTIESRESTPPELAAQMGSWVFGCDVCQSVCPWNRKHLQTDSQASAAKSSLAEPLDPSDPFQLNGTSWLQLLAPGGGFQSRFKSTPLLRAGRKGMLRNVIAAATRQNDLSVLPQLRENLSRETDLALQSLLRDAVVQLEAKASPN